MYKLVFKGWIYIETIRTRTYRLNYNTYDSISNIKRRQVEEASRNSHFVNWCVFSSEMFSTNNNKYRHVAATFIQSHSPCSFTTYEPKAILFLFLHLAGFLRRHFQNISVGWVCVCSPIGNRLWSARFYCPNKNRSLV